MGDITTKFLEEMIAAGCQPKKSSIIADDKVHNYKIVDGSNGTYKLKADGDFGVGWYINHREGISHKFLSKSSKKLSPEELKKLQVKREAEIKAAKEERKKLHIEVAKEAKKIWEHGHR